MSLGIDAEVTHPSAGDQCQGLLDVVQSFLHERDDQEAHTSVLGLMNEIEDVCNTTKLCMLAIVLIQFKLQLLLMNHSIYHYKVQMEVNRMKD